MRRALGFVLAFLLATSIARGANVALVSEEFMVPSDTAGIQLYVRNKHPRGQNTYPSEKIVLLLHGSTTPSEAVYDFPLGGISWMDYIAQRGYDVYLTDVRGYGRSSKPPEMDQPGSANPPIVRSEVWIRDLTSVIDFIKKRRHAPKVALVAWSFGTAIIGAYAAAHNESVTKLVMYAPQWTRSGPSPTIGTSGPLPAYRTVSGDAAKTLVFLGVPDQKKATLVPDGWLEQWSTATYGTGLRVPNGWAQDGADYWNVGKPYYDPSKITVPTMLVHGEWDAILPSAMTEAYWKQLTSTPYKRWIEIGESTHHIFLQKNRIEMFREVQVFLDDAYKPES